MPLCGRSQTQGGERPAPIPTHAVTAPKADAATTAEKKNAETPRAEPDEELAPFLSPYRQSRRLRSKRQQPEPTPPTPQPTIELQPSDEVYIPGFGWVPYEGPNHREYAADMYENGNKIGSMG